MVLFIERLEQKKVKKLKRISVRSLQQKSDNDDTFTLSGSTFNVIIFKLRGCE